MQLSEYEGLAIGFFDLIPDFSMLFPVEFLTIF